MLPRAKREKQVYLSSRRKPGSRSSENGWIPACAGMTQGQALFLRLRREQ